MVVSSEKENHVSPTMEDLREPPPMESMLQSPPTPAAYTDVTVVPEQEKNELEKTIATLQEEIAQLRQKQRLIDEKRKVALNNIIDIKGSIRVFCRVRPVLSTDRRKFHQPILTELDKIKVKIPGAAKEFGFDKVFHQESNQEDVFTEVKPILRSALDGHNVCVLAYGQTGTGKTFTMDGANGQPGIVPRVLEELFSGVDQVETASHVFSISMLEVYLGNLRDLLAQKPALKPHEASTRCNLNIQTDPKGLVEIEGLTEVQVSETAKAKWWYNKGRRARSTSWTNVNESSSRSHWWVKSLTRITITRVRDSGAKPETSKLWMVDLGGSERVLKTGATGQTLDEGRAINLSLSALGDVIAALRKKKGHVPYRNSKLTQILKDSLGYGSKVLMLVHVSPCDDDVAETICSLSFAKRARAVESSRDIPEDLKRQREKRLAELEEQMKTAEEEQHKIRDQLLKTEFLLTENMKLFSTAYGPIPFPTDEENQTISTPREAFKTPIPLRPRLSNNSLPRFMTSTAASRHRQGASEREIMSKAKSLRSAPRSSVLSVSQSLSYSGPLLNQSKKTRFSAVKPLPISGMNSDLDTKAPLSARSKVVTSSDPNLRVTLGRHKRRNSSLI